MTLQAIVLGAAQDAGLPQAGCDCPACAAARLDPALRQFAACLALVDRQAGQAWLLDATPDLREQLALLAGLAPGCKLAGIVLTHAHIGHYLGLAQLGREAMNTRGLPVYASAAMAAFLRQNAPWRQLVEIGNIVLRLVEPGQPFQLGALRLEPFAVPHRAEYSDTLGYLIQGPGRRLCYLPDIDTWEGRDWRSFLAGCDPALLDGTFFSPAELPGRNLSEIPHPFVQLSAAQLANAAAPQANTAVQVCFIHLNHSNPLWHDGAERRWLAELGLQVAHLGQRWSLEG